MADSKPDRIDPDASVYEDERDDGRVKRMPSGTREARDRLSERPDAARQTERTPHGIGAVSEVPEERSGPRHGRGEQDAEGVIGTMPQDAADAGAAADPSPRETRFDGDELHEGDNMIIGEGATIRKKGE